MIYFSVPTTILLVLFHVVQRSTIKLLLRILLITSSYPTSLLRSLRCKLRNNRVDNEISNRYSKTPFVKCPLRQQHRPWWLVLSTLLCVSSFVIASVIENCNPFRCTGEKLLACTRKIKGADNNNIIKGNGVQQRGQRRIGSGLVQFYFINYCNWFCNSILSLHSIDIQLPTALPKCHCTLLPQRNRIEWAAMGRRRMRLEVKSSIVSHGFLLLQ